MNQEAQLLIRMLDLSDRLNVELGRRSSAEHIDKLREHLEKDGDVRAATLGFRAAVAMCRAATETSIVEAAQGRKIGARDYIKAYLVTGGKKSKMAECLDVSTQGLYQYETEHADRLRMLKPEIDDEMISLLAMLLATSSPSSS